MRGKYWLAVMIILDYCVLKGIQLMSDIIFLLCYICLLIVILKARAFIRQQPSQALSTSRMIDYWKHENLLYLSQKILQDLQQGCIFS